MRYFMSQPNFAAKAFRLAVPSIVAVFVCGGPAFAHSHWHVHGHVHRAPMQTYNVAPHGGFGVYSPAAGFDGTSSMAAAQASAAGVPVSLVERVIRRESGGNARAVHAGNYGLMQIRLSTARAMGYTGSAAGLLDPQTNMTYAVRYLAGAYRAAGGNESRAVALYSRGYYYQAKAQGFSPYASSAM
jgi:soluble lytic murein transglycosylase-like protein